MSDVVRQTDVLIAGAGPGGLALAIELGRRGIRCSVVERLSRGAYKTPRTMLINSRSMEHLRRWGIAGKLRAANPIDPDLVADVVFATRLTGKELHRFHRPFVGEGRDERLSEGAEWIPQRTIEAVLESHAGDYESVDLRFGTEVTGFTPEADGVTVHMVDESGRDHSVRSGYLIGCDGSHSTVRRLLGVRLEGRPEIMRALKYEFVAPELKSIATVSPASFYWFVNGSYDGRVSVLFNALDDRGGWAFGCYPIPPGVDPDNADQAKEILYGAIGQRPQVEIVAGGGWTMHAIVAPRFDFGRVLLAGDAAHLMPNLGGFGMNSALLDSVDLGWKLAAVIAGWGGEHLLASYTFERKSVCQWVMTIQEDNVRILSPELYRPLLEEDSFEGEAAREEAAAAIVAAKTQEFYSLGLQKGYRYTDSPIVAAEPTAPILDHITYRPTATPGSVAPHSWNGDTSLYDLFGDEFTLLILDEREPSMFIVEAAQAEGVPLRVVAPRWPGLLELYGARMALVRPDQHVAWRGDSAPSDVRALLRKVVGR